MLSWNLHVIMWHEDTIWSVNTPRIIQTKQQCRKIYAYIKSISVFIDSHSSLHVCAYISISTKKQMYICYIHIRSLQFKTGNQQTCWNGVRESAEWTRFLSSFSLNLSKNHVFSWWFFPQRICKKQGFPNFKGENWNINISETITQNGWLVGIPCGFVAGHCWSNSRSRGVWLRVIQIPGANSPTVLSTNKKTPWCWDKVGKCIGNIYHPKNPDPSKWRFWRIPKKHPWYTGGHLNFCGPFTKMHQQSHLPGCLGFQLYDFTGIISQAMK